VVIRLVGAALIGATQVTVCPRSARGRRWKLFRRDVEALLAQQLASNRAAPRALASYMNGLAPSSMAALAAVTPASV
jgi:hypothetical protein